MRVETKTEIQTKEVQFNTYIADDGKEFDDAKECELYELNIKKQNLKNKLDMIQTSNEVYGCPPVDGGEYYENHDFKWYLPKTQDEADTIIEYYNLECGISSDEIGEWICVEAYDIEDPTDGCYSMPIRDSINYVNTLFNALGYDVAISKREEN